MIRQIWTIGHSTRKIDDFISFLKVRVVEVTHIVDPDKSEPHPYTSAAKIVDGTLSYGADSPLQFTAQLTFRPPPRL